MKTYTTEHILNHVNTVNVNSLEGILDTDNLVYLLK